MVIRPSIHPENVASNLVGSCGVFLFWGCQPDFDIRYADDFPMGFRDHETPSVSWKYGIEPRTTRTQEGLAVFAELATRSIDIARLWRLALRILALKAVLDGADFIECFKIFLDGGQDERESYKSAQRIFRGGDVRGKIAFTKDSAYLKGLMEMHVLMNLAIRDNQPQMIEHLFAGRLTMRDAIVLDPYFGSCLRMLAQV